VAAQYGHERSGETKSTSPSDPAVTNTALGYDWSSVHVDFRTVTVQHAGGTTGKQRPGIEVDFEFANQIFAGVGITAHHVDPAGVKNYTNPAIPTPIRDRVTAKSVTKEYRADAGDDQINVYYVDKIELGPDDNLSKLAGLTLQPSASDVEAGINDGILIGNGAVRVQADTFAHEAVHYLFGSKATALGELETDDRIYRHVNPFDPEPPDPPDPPDPNEPDTDPAPDQGAHAPNEFRGQNLMNRLRKPTEVPERERLTDSDDYPKKSTENTAPSDPLLNPYSRDGVSGLRRDQLNGEVYFDDDGTGQRIDPNEDAEPFVPQIMGIYESKYVKGKGVVHAENAAVADLKWVEDSWRLKNLPGVDVTFRPTLLDDGLRFTMYPPGTPDPAAHDLNVGNYTGAWFNVVDVLSNIARYSDNDVSTATGNWSAGNSALDYIVEFSETGEFGTWQEGTLVDAFIDGWTDQSTADDMVARWAAPAGMMAQFVEISAIPKDMFGHDGNAQIDAIIAGVDPNLVVANFQIDGADPGHKSFYVDYVINAAPVDELTLRVYSSPDGVQFGSILKEVTYSRNDGFPGDDTQLDIGGHQWKFQNIVPPNGDH
jgi:hypothetical protein